MNNADRDSAAVLDYMWQLKREIQALAQIQTVKPSTESEDYRAVEARVRHPDIWLDDAIAEKVQERISPDE